MIGDGTKHVPATTPYYTNEEQPQWDGSDAPLEVEFDIKLSNVNIAKSIGIMCLTKKCIEAQRKKHKSKQHKAHMRRI